MSLYTKSLGEAALQHLYSLRLWRIFLRLLFVILKVKGYSNTCIAEILSVSRKTVWEWHCILESGGLDGLTTLHYKGQPSKLNAYGEQLAFEFDENPVATLKEAQHYIEERTGLKRSLPQVRAFLKRIKIKRRKVGQIPSKANLNAQKKFKEEELEPLIEKAKSGLIRLFFVDASHFVHLPFLGYLYSLKRIFIRSAPGRKRFNVLGALDAVNNTLITICNEQYINAQTVCQLLQQIATECAGQAIHIVLDNARYQRCRLVMETAAALGIELVFLEPYSPHLNLIERLWKFIKKKVLYNKFYETFEKFRLSINTCLEKINDGHYCDELKSLLTLEFQTFDVLQTKP